MPTLADFYAASNENAALAKGKEAVSSGSGSAPTETVSKTEVLEKFIEAYASFLKRQGRLPVPR